MRSRNPSTVVTMGDLRITYLRNQPVAVTVEGVTQRDFERLSTVLDAHRKVVEARGTLKAHPNAHTRQLAFELLGMKPPPPEPEPEFKPFPLVSHVVRHSRRRNIATPRPPILLDYRRIDRIELLEVIEAVVLAAP